MHGRQDPLPQPTSDEKNSFMRLVEDWLGQSWLSQPHPSHPVQRLWQRRDWLATLELLTIGHALDNVRQFVHGGWLRRGAKIVKGADRGNAAGMIFELLAASMLSGAGISVSVPATGNPGYDLVARDGSGGALLISCKTLVPPARYFSFRDFCLAATRPLAESLVRGSQMLAKLFLPGMATQRIYQPEPFSEQLVEKYRLWLRNPSDEMMDVDGWMVRFDSLAPRPGGVFWSEYPSYRFEAWTPYLDEERRQLRLRSKLLEAFQNLKEQCNPGPSEGNVVFVKVPVGVPVADTLEWLRESWGPETAHISGVVIYRLSVASEHGDHDQVTLTHELKTVTNPNNKRGMWFLDNPTRLSVLAGRIASCEPWMAGESGGGLVDFTSFLTFFCGHEYYDMARSKKDLQTSRVPGNLVTMVQELGGGKALFINPRYPLYDETLLI